MITGRSPQIVSLCFVGMSETCIMGPLVEFSV